MQITCRDLGLMAYDACWEYQRQLFDELLAAKASAAQRAANDPVSGRFIDETQRERPDSAGTLLLVEHPPVYTLGKSGKAANLLCSEAWLRARGAEVFRIDRGGDITFHGPGQLVGYPILDLERIGIGLRRYVELLEESVIDAVAHYGICGIRSEGASGVWIAPAKNRPLRKICAIGVRSSRYVTMHGFALNVATDLQWFDYINPCGFSDRGVASIEGETGKRVAMDEVKELVATCLAKNLKVEIYKK